MKKITSIDVQRALKKHTSTGGMIRKLPAEKAIQTRIVGENYGAYENLLNPRCMGVIG